MASLALYGLQSEKRDEKLPGKSAEKGGRQAKSTDHLKTTSCKSLMAYFYESFGIS